MENDWNMGQRDFLNDRIEDASAYAVKNDACVFLDFYEPAIQLLIEKEIARYPECDCAFFGGNDYSERKILSIFKKNCEPDLKIYPLKCLQFEADEIEHKDVLGALIALGIQRDKIGDINFFNETVQIFIAEPIDIYVVQNLCKIANKDIECREVAFEDIKENEPKFINLDIIIASMRIDNVMHAVFKMSRNEAQAFIKADKVKINHKPVTKSSVNIKSGDIVSVRSKGRLLVDMPAGTTKKGNIKLKVRKFQ